MNQTTIASAYTVAAAGPWPSSTLLTTLFVAGVGSHHLIRPYEIDSYVISLGGAYLATLAATSLGYFQTIAGLDAWTAVSHTFALSCVFNAGLVSSILIYRVFFHRLHRFPGPFAAKVSRVYAARASADKLQMHLESQRMHDEYGDFVRTGPRHLSILRASAIPAIYGPATKCVRSPWYAATPGGLNDLSLLQLRDPETHKRRKKHWERGLSFKALNSYEPRVRAKADLLLERLSENAGKPIDMTMYGMFYGFDVMSEVGFSKDFNMLKSQKEHPAVMALHSSLTILSVVGGSQPWLLGMMTRIPGASAGYQKFIEWCGGELQARKAAYKKERANSLQDQDPSDVVSWLIKAEEDGEKGAPGSNLSWQEEARLLIVAGSDTTSTVLTNTLYFLASNPGCYQKLQEQVDAALKADGGDGTAVSHEKIKDVAYLDWLIQETLRLKPAVPSGVTRLTPPEGLQIDEVHIPGDTIVVVPMHSIQRDPRYWGGAEDAVSYRPERWEDLSTEKAPWMAFNRGAGVCPGKNLAFMELRLVLAKIAARFEVPRFAPGFDPEAFDHGSEDRFTMHLPELNLVFTER
ncbi:cytochrome P450 [Apiospora sp. TS-2023a]